MSIWSNRIERETKTIQIMVAIYCQHHHHLTVSDCDECSNLQQYALERLQNCPYEEGKTSCKKCPIHCYKPGMKDEVKRVMRFSGPRMTLRHPILTLFHFVDDRRSTPIDIGSKRSDDQGESGQECTGPIEASDLG